MKKLFKIFLIMTMGFPFLISIAHTQELKVKPFGTAYVTSPQWKFKDTDPNQNDILFDLTRFYVGFNWEFDTIYGKVTHDLVRSNTASTGAGSAIAGDLLQRMKHGYVGWNYVENHAVELGLVGLEEAQPNEKMLRRYITPSALDKVGYANTADLGIQLTGKFHNNIFKYFLAVINGEGYNAPETTKTKDVTLRLIAEPSGKSKDGFTFAGLAHIGKTDVGVTRNRFDLQAYYSIPKLTVGGLGALVKTTNETETRIGSLLLDWQFISKWFWLTRWDLVAPSGTKDDYNIIIAGVEHKLNPHLSFALDWQAKLRANEGSSLQEEKHAFIHALFQF